MSRNSKLPRSESKIIRARCSPELKDRLVRTAKANGSDESTFLREAAEEYLDNLAKGIPRRFIKPPPPEKPIGPTREEFFQAEKNH